MSKFGPKKYHIYCYYYEFEGIRVGLIPVRFYVYVGHTHLPGYLSDQYHKFRGEDMTTFRHAYRHSHVGRTMFKRHDFKSTTLSLHQALKWEQNLTKLMVKKGYPLLNDDLNQLDGKHGQRKLNIV